LAKCISTFDGGVHVVFCGKGRAEKGRRWDRQKGERRKGESGKGSCVLKKCLFLRTVFDAKNTTQKIKT